MLLLSLGLLWVSLIGTGVVLFGLRDRSGEAPWPRYVMPAAVLTALVLLVVLPAATVLYGTGEHRHESRSGVVLSDAQVHGRELFSRTCIRCHTLGDIRAPATIGPSFDRLRPSRALVEDAIANGRARGNGQMPAGLLGAEDAQDVADYLSAVAGRSSGDGVP